MLHLERKRKSTLIYLLKKESEEPLDVGFLLSQGEDNDWGGQILFYLLCVQIWWHFRLAVPAPLRNCSDCLQTDRINSSVRLHFQIFSCVVFHFLSFLPWEGVIKKLNLYVPFRWIVENCRGQNIKYENIKYRLYLVPICWETHIWRTCSTWSPQVLTVSARTASL